MSGFFTNDRERRIPKPRFQLNDEQRHALKLVRTYPDHTARELQALDTRESDVHRRLTELQRYGFIEAPRKRRCSVTGARANIWRCS